MDAPPAGVTKGAGERGREITYPGPGRSTTGPRFGCDSGGVLSAAVVYELHQSFDWVTQFVAPLIAALIAATIGAGAAIWAAKRTVGASATQATQQLDAARESLQTQLDAERALAREEREANRRDRLAEREEERKADLLDMLEAAREELRVNVAALDGVPPKGDPGPTVGYDVGWPLLSTEFIHSLLVSRRVIDPTAVATMTTALLAVRQFNTTAAIVNTNQVPRDHPLWDAANNRAREAVEAMTPAVASLGRQIQVFPNTWEPGFRAL